MRLILILGDQLSRGISSLANAAPADDLVLMAEVAAEATYVRHHKKKIAFLFSAMRHFADALRADGWRVRYTQLDEPRNAGDLFAEVKRALADHPEIERVVVTEPGEWRLREEMADWHERLGLPVGILADDRFVCSHREFEAWARARQSLVMEFFYREMRRKTDLLMEDGEPVGGRWNFDKENRKPARRDLLMPEPSAFEPDAITRDVLALVASRFGDHFGDVEPFRFAVTREQALQALDHFMRHALPCFGDFQDAMLLDERFLYHSVLSPYINAGLLDPLEVCRRAEHEYQEGRAPLNAAEGFIRQIIGWREFVRGVYWLKMPDYAEVNHLEARRPLPWFYWSTQTDMTCMAAVLGQTRHEAYAHHIQRLMVTGLFAMLAGVEPRQVHEWYLIVYADAYEWVEMPNTIGMSQYADGGVLGTKPYAASGNYINRMSDYCKACLYDVKKRSGDGACPFNLLYWDFLARNEHKLRHSRRMAMMYRNLDRLPKRELSTIRLQAAAFLDGLDQQAPSGAGTERV